MNLIGLLIAHQFRAPNDAVDLAIALGKISTNLPAIKRASVLALSGNYATESEAIAKVAAASRGKYGNQPDTDKAVQAIYRQNSSIPRRDGMSSCAATATMAA